jgi:hypothetical protein
MLSMGCFYVWNRGCCCRRHSHAHRPANRHAHRHAHDVDPGFELQFILFDNLIYFNPIMAVALNYYFALTFTWDKEHETPRVAIIDN